MSVPVTLILEALSKAGIGDIVEKFIDKGNDADKAKLVAFKKTVSLLVETMDDAGKCDIKTVIKALVEDD